MLLQYSLLKALKDFVISTKMQLQKFQYKLLLSNFINLKAYPRHYDIHNTPFQVLNFRPRSIGESPKESTSKKT